MSRRRASPPSTTDGTSSRSNPKRAATGGRVWSVPPRPLPKAESRVMSSATSGPPVDEALDERLGRGRRHVAIEGVADEEIDPQRGEPRVPLRRVAQEERRHAPQHHVRVGREGHDGRGGVPRPSGLDERAEQALVAAVHAVERAHDDGHGPGVATRPQVGDDLHPLRFRRFDGGGRWASARDEDLLGVQPPTFQAGDGGQPPGAHPRSARACRARRAGPAPRPRRPPRHAAGRPGPGRARPSPRAAS